MKQIIRNQEIKPEEVDMTVIRVKAFIINSQNEILIAHNNGTYQLIGGHKKQDESLEDALTREITEETGIEIKGINGPFLQLTTYHKNYLGTNQNICDRIYYYDIKTDIKPDITKTNYDWLETMSEFKLYYIPIFSFSNFVEEKVQEGQLNKEIAEEIRIAFLEYQKRKY